MTRRRPRRTLHEVQVSVLLPDLGSELGGVFALQGSAFQRAAAASHEIVLIGVAIVLLAGFSEAVAHSIVLFVNRVKPVRFAFSWAIGALLFAFGYAFLVLSTWLVCRLPGAPHLGLGVLAVVFALSYAPLLFSFLGAMPYLGPGILTLLRVWHLLAIVVGLSAVGNVTLVAAASYGALGWIVMVLSQQSFGKPIAQLGARLLDSVAGETLVDDEQLVIGRAVRADAREVRAGAPPARNAEPTSPHPNAWKAALGLLAVAALAFAVALALDPVRGAMFGWETMLPRVVRIPIDLFWLGVVAFVVSAFMAPMETLGWWAGWYGDTIDAAPETGTLPPSESAVTRYAIYLDGIAQSSARYTPDIETFLDALAPELPAGVRLIRGVMCYSVMNRPLEDDPIFSWLWSYVDRERFSEVGTARGARAFAGSIARAFLGMLVNLRNVTIVGVSADPRYGPIYNFGITQVMVKSLLADGYRPNSGIPVTLIGYSGGGQMACGSARFLKRAIGAPLDVISLGGVISGDDPILDLEHLHHFVGDKDKVERIGPVMFASRWKIAVLSNWNRARRLGRLTQMSLGPVGHQVPGGMLDPQTILPDGRSALRQTLDLIETVLAGHPVAGEIAPPVKQSAYARALELPWNQPASFPPRHDVPPGYRPAGRWVGRLILPSPDARFGGALFEVLHAPDDASIAIGTIVKLTWNAQAADVAELLRAARRDVNFSADASYASQYGGSVNPTRLNHWRLVDPLESLAGAHPIDDAIVKLTGPVSVEGQAGATVLRIEREPVQVAGPLCALVAFVGTPSDAANDGSRVRVRHYDPDAGAFTGREETMLLEPGSGAPAPGGWYVYGAHDVGGVFCIRAIERDVAAWPNAREGESALAIRTAGGAFGEFCYGIARFTDDPLAGAPRIETTYYRLSPHDGNGSVAGAVDAAVLHAAMERCGRQARTEATESIVHHRELAELLPELARALEIMSARYRIGDGTGATYAGALHNPALDSNRALGAAVAALAISSALVKTLRRVTPSPSKHGRDDTLGIALADDPVRNAAAALSGWRWIVPALARRRIVRAFLRCGATVTEGPSARAGQSSEM
jgi:hypothetical protein